MKCPNCNKKIKETDVLCPHCGIILKEENPTSRLEKRKQERARKQKRKNRIIFFLCLVGIVIITIIAVQAFIAKNNTENSSEDNKIVLNVNFYQINVDETAQIDVEGNDLTFVSQNTKVAIVDNEGVITGKKLGKTIIHISDKRGNVATCSVNVIDNEIGQTVEESIVETIEEKHDDDYIIADSSERILQESDLQSLSKEQLSLARNEIFARKGRKFKVAAIQEYFDSKSWYHGTIEPADFSNNMLNEIERANVDFINKYEKNMN